MSLRMIKAITIVILILAVWGCNSKPQANSPQRWWPIQKAPAGIVKTVPHEAFEKATSPNGKATQGHLSATHIMIESLSGLAANAVNNGTCDEMIWIEVGNLNKPQADYELNYNLLKEKIGFEERGTFASWELVERFVKKGIVKGYVLYRYDYSKGNVFSKRNDADHSVNAATMAAAVQGGLLIEEGQEEKAKALGLKLLYDARDKSVKDVFGEYKDRLNRNFALATDPKVGHCRDFAIAYKCPVFIGLEGPAKDILGWLEPLSPIMGYLWEDEFKETRLYSQYGHFTAATNWSLNIPLFLAVEPAQFNAKLPSVDPSKIDYKSTKKACSFVLSDGDNMCWLTGNFINHKYYWNNDLRGQFPFNWTSCFANLSQAASVTTEYLIQNLPANSNFIEYGGGYQYPDAFAIDRPNRKELLTQFARRTWQRMEAMNVKVFGFITEDFDSKNAVEAYEIYAKEMPGLTGMIAVQYYPYEGGTDDIIWVKNARGIDIPVVRASFALWANYPTPNGGTPAKIARLINDDAKQRETSYNWVIEHAWSGFKKSETDDENAENGQFGQPGNETGLIPVDWTIKRLDKDIKVVSIEELLWLIRMEHNPAQTNKIIQKQ